MEKPQKHIIVIAGEASGDMHAAALIREIRSLNPNVTFSGLGGTQMEEAGVHLYANLVDLAVMGFAEVLKHLGRFKNLFLLALKKIEETNADCVILIDYPGFNLRLARRIKELKLNAKVIYYISPQVWAWHKERVHFIKKYVDHMLVLFSFEEEFYRKHEMTAVSFVGHPLLDIIKVSVDRKKIFETYGLSNDKLTIAILPGSRKNEVQRHLDIMMQAAQILYSEFTKIQFILLKAPTLSETVFHGIIEKHTTLPFLILHKQAYDGINASDFCIVASGTATLETAILQKPMVIMYKTSFLTWLIAKIFVKIPYIGLVNVVAGKKIVPECVQFNCTPQKVADEIRAMMTNETKIAEIKQELKKVKESLGSPGASRRAAEIILKLL